MYLVKVLPDESRVIAKKGEDGAVTLPKTVSLDGKRVSLTKKRTPVDMHRLVRDLNSPAS